MNIIKPSATLMEHDVTPYEFIERIGRTCYKSEDKITKGSAEKFVASLVKREHMAMLEHETIYLVVSRDFMEGFLEDLKNEDIVPKFFNITNNSVLNVYIISGSFRSFYDLFSKCNGYTVEHIKRGLRDSHPIVFDKFEDNMFMETYPTDSVFLCNRTNFIEMFKHLPEVLSKHLTHSVKFVCDRGVSHELVRHRVASFAQESTRYCNYAKDKFGNEITVILPCFFDTGMGTMSNSLVYDTWKHSCEVAERDYFKLLEMGATPQEARSVLPNSLKTELIVTATEEEWRHITNLRYLGTTGAPHPQAKEVMGLILTDLSKASSFRIIGE